LRRGDSLNIFVDLKTVKKSEVRFPFLSECNHRQPTLLLAAEVFCFEQKAEPLKLALPKPIELYSLQTEADGL
jgi:hypothetical protein